MAAGIGTTTTTTSPAGQLAQLTECTICAYQLREPKVLTCGHTFCLRCLERHGKERSAGEKVACPLCRKEFVVPLGGWRELTTNYLVVQLLEYGQGTAVGPRTRPKTSRVSWAKCRSPPARGNPRGRSGAAKSVTA